MEIGNPLMLNKVIIPGSWSEMTYGMFLKVMPVVISEPMDDVTDITAGIENSIKLLAAITDSEYEELQALPMPFLQPYIKRLSFAAVMPKANAGSQMLRFVAPDKILYDKYSLLITTTDFSPEALPGILKSFTVQELDEDDIKAMPVQEVYDAFFMLKENVIEYLQTLKPQVVKELGLLTVMENLTRIRSQVIGRKKRPT